MKETKPKPRASKLPLREPAKPLEQPESKPLSPDHPIFNLIAPAKEAQDHPPPTTHHPPPTQVAPTRDFVKVPNSVVRDALPAGLFKGESKKTYDALYQRTRGAITPRRMIRATLADVMAWAGVSHNTLKAHIKHLSRVGLIHVHYVRGDNTGAEYEVLTPEENSHQPPTTHHPPTTQNLAPPTTQNLVVGGGGQVVDNTITYESPKTSFKTNTEKSDDEPPAALREAEREVTGKSSTVTDWQPLFELLAAELRIAAKRTTVSSAPAFLTEHLKRRLWKLDRQPEKLLVTNDKVEGKSLLTSEQIKSCPDCAGTGFYYPNGYDAGVVKCRHERVEGK